MFVLRLMDSKTTATALADCKIENRSLPVMCIADMLLQLRMRVSFETVYASLLQSHDCQTTFCFITVFQNNHRLLQTIQHVLYNMQSPPDCPVLFMVHTYFELNGVFPTQHEFEDFIFMVFPRNTIEPISTGVPDLSVIPVSTAQEEQSCGICQENILVGQKQYDLICSHSFHFSGDECIGTSVSEWFQSHQTCPMCRTNIS